jgi:DNA-binding MarR family transcriptional regulator
MKANAIEGLLAAIRALSNDFDHLSQAVADHVGLSATDLSALDLISRHNGVTARQIGDHLHMTSGAITGVIDRLERAGLARRAPDRVDRRRIMVVATPKEHQIHALYDPLVEALGSAAAGYSEADLSLLRRFIEQVRTAVINTSEGITRS